MSPSLSVKNTMRQYKISPNATALEFIKNELQEPVTLFYVILVVYEKHILIQLKLIPTKFIWTV